MLGIQFFRSKNIINIVRNTFVFLKKDSRVEYPPSIKRLIAFGINAQLAYKYYMVNFPENPSAGVAGIIRAGLKSLVHATQVKIGCSPEQMVTEAITKAIDIEHEKIMKESALIFAKVAKEEGITFDESTPELLEDRIKKAITKELPFPIEIEFEEVETEPYKTDLKVLKVGVPALDLPHMAKLRHSDAAKILYELPERFSPKDILLLSSEEKGSHLIKTINSIVGEDAPLELKLKVLEKLLSELKNLGLVEKYREVYLNKINLQRKFAIGRKIKMFKHEGVDSFSTVKFAKPRPLGAERYGSKVAELGKPITKLRRQLTFKKIVSRIAKQQHIRPEDIIAKTYKPSVRADFLIALDSSQSMQGAGLTETKFDDAKQAVVKLVQTISQTGNDRLGVVTFEVTSDIAAHLTPVRTHKQQLIKLLDGVSASGGTKISTALEKAETEFKKSKAQIKILILLSDGETKDDQELCREIARRLANQNVIIHAIGLGSSYDEKFLGNLSKIGRGIFIAARDSKNLDAIVQTLYALSRI